MLLDVSVLVLLLSDEAAAIATATAAANAATPTNAPVDRPPRPPVVASPLPVETPGSGPRALFMACSCGVAGGLADGGVGGVP